MCNLYNNTTSQEAMRRLFKGLDDLAGNLQTGSVYPDQYAPIIRHGEAGLELAKARWGMPTPPQFLKTDRDPGVTNVRNTGSPHWRRWLGPENRCLVPLTSFAEPLGEGRGNQWFALRDAKPAFFAGLEVRGWNSVRKVKDGKTVDDLFAFLTTEPNAEVASIHPKAMPVILVEEEDWTSWLTADWTDAKALQRPLLDGTLELIDRPL